MKKQINDTTLGSVRINSQALANMEQALKIVNEIPLVSMDMPFYRKFCYNAISTMILSGQIDQIPELNFKEVNK